MLDELNLLKTKFVEECEKIGSSVDLDQIQIKYLGRKGFISSYFKQLKNVSSDERPLVGQRLNELKKHIETELEELGKKFIKAVEKEKTQDVTLPGFKRFVGKKHPLNKILDEIKSIFRFM